MSRWENKYVIGLTGNIAVGKSVVRQMLQHLGAYTIDADSLSHQVMMPGAPAYQPIIDTFGRFMLDGEGRINRARLGALVFALPEALTMAGEGVRNSEVLSASKMAASRSTVSLRAAPLPGPACILRNRHTISQLLSWHSPHR